MSLSDQVGAGIHLRTKDRVAVLDALAHVAAATGLAPTDDDGTQARPTTELRALVAPARAGWTSVYVEQTWRAPSLAAALARRAKVPALLVRLASEWACAYQAYDASGGLADAYHSCPDADKAADEDDASADELERTRGDAAALAAALGGGREIERLAAVMTEQRVERLRDHDAVGGVLPDPDLVFAALETSFGLPELRPDFDEVRHVLADEEGLDLVLRAFTAGAERPVASGDAADDDAEDDDADDDDADDDSADDDA